jgi:hypothetical protein
MSEPVSSSNGGNNTPGIPTSTHSFYIVILLLAIGFIVLIVVTLCTLRDSAFNSPPSSPKSHYMHATGPGPCIKNFSAPF